MDKSKGFRAEGRLVKFVLSFIIPHGNSHNFGIIELDTVSLLKLLLIKKCAPSLPHV